MITQNLSVTVTIFQKGMQKTFLVLYSQNICIENGLPAIANYGESKLPEFLLREVGTPRGVHCCESNFDYKYLPEYEAKIENIFTLVNVPLVSYRV